MYLHERGKLESTWFLACSPPINYEIFRMSLLKIVLPFFDQSRDLSHLV